MIRRRFWASVWLFCCLLAKAESQAVDTDNSCITFAFPEDDLTSQRKIMARLDSFLERNQDKGPQTLRDEDDLTAQRKIMARLDSFLERNQDKGPQTLRDVLAVAGKEEKDLDMKIGKEEPLEAVLLRYLIFLHQDVRTLLEVKAPLIRYLKKKPMDCSEHLVYGITKSGVYEIYPYPSTCQCSRPVKVFCDMETDGGGWTVFLSRAKVSQPVNFFRNWNDYKTGFGTPGEEHWLGNEHLHTLTSTRNYVLRLEAKDRSGREIWGEWNTFAVNSESNLYKLTAVDANPNNIAYDRFINHTGQRFTTFDRDNDLYTTGNCAAKFKGGWWYNDCHYINPTGVHDKEDSDGIKFQPWSKEDNWAGYATHVQLKIRPNICGSIIPIVELNSHNCNFN